MKATWDCLHGAWLGLWFSIPMICLATTISLAQATTHKLDNVLAVVEYPHVRNLTQ